MQVTDQVIFDDETAQILQSYPKTTHNANESALMQRTLESGQSGFNLTQKMANLVSNPLIEDKNSYEQENAAAYKGFLSDDTNS